MLAHRVGQVQPVPAESDGRRTGAGRGSLQPDDAGHVLAEEHNEKTGDTDVRRGVVPV